MAGAGILLFQVAPVLLITFYLYSFSGDSPESGWLVSEEGDCKYFTNYNKENRAFEWDGDCKNGLVHGKGTLTLFQNDYKLYVFNGTMVDGKMNGQGVIRSVSDGDRYEGQFKDSHYHGFGHLFNDDGDHYEGQFENGFRSGMGTYWYEPDGKIFKYVGEWKDGKQNGRGELFYWDGTREKGLFKDGELIGPLLTENTVASPYPKNVLITNDDGMEDLNRLVCLAEAVSEFAEMVVVVASSENKSGTSNRMSVTQTRELKGRLVSSQEDKNIYVYEVDGYPADCVLLGALGIFEEQGRTIDLVISGINGGSNIGAAWFGSGTVGAARTAALAGIPAIAVSGIDEDKANPQGLQRLCKWVTDIAGTSVVTNMERFDYLTISIPEDLDAIQGVKFLERAISFDGPPFSLEKEVDSEDQITWKLLPGDQSKVYNMPAENDVFYYFQNYIVAVPMSVNENALDKMDAPAESEEILWSLFNE